MCGTGLGSDAKRRAVLQRRNEQDTLASRELASTSGVTPIKMRRDELLTAEDFACRLFFRSQEMLVS